MSSELFRVIGGPQNYAWGKLGSSSAVAQFAQANDPENVKIDESLPYAELWMGTHPKVPTLLADTREELRKVIESDPKKYLGESIIKKFGSSDELPFLFKVLSINKVLSIQAHPNKELGSKLHFDDPTNYPDGNHKPEMAIALTDFESFCGFQPLEQIKSNLLKFKPFKDLVGEETSKNFIENPSKDNLQAVFSKVMNAPKDQVDLYASQLVQLAKTQSEIFGSTLADLILRLNEQFPLDIGLFCGCLMLNHCNLKTGEAMFLQALEPHAYISGDIMECMAASDNVIRAGFTPKFIDVQNLVNSLTYSTNDVEKQKLTPAPFPRGSGVAQFDLYDPPIDEFSVLQVSFDNVEGIAEIKGIDGPSVAIVSQGSGKLRIKGDASTTIDGFAGGIYFIAPGAEVELISENKDIPFTIYRAYCEA